MRYRRLCRECNIGSWVAHRMKDTRALHNPGKLALTCPCPIDACDCDLKANVVIIDMGQALGHARKAWRKR